MLKQSTCNCMDAFAVLKRCIMLMTIRTLTMYNTYKSNPGATARDVNIRSNSVQFIIIITFLIAHGRQLSSAS